MFLIHHKRGIGFAQQYPNEFLNFGSLCIRLPCDNTDSKSWILPLLLTAMPNLTSLGEPNIYEGLKLMYDLKDIKTPKEPFKLEEAIIKLDEASVVRIMAKQFMRLLSLTTLYTKWNRFIETLGKCLQKYWFCFKLLVFLKLCRSKPMFFSNFYSICRFFESKKSHLIL